MQHFARAARAAAATGHGATASASVAAAAVAASAQPARRPPQVPSIADDWLVTEVDNETVLFRPYSEAEVDACVEDVRRLVSRPVGGHGVNVVIEEVSVDNCYGSPRTSRCSSINGESSSQADRVIEATHLESTYAGADSTAAEQQRQLQSLLHMTSKMLKRPGMQREVFAAMLDDPEVRTLMLRETRDLDAYLISCGISAPSNLLTESDVTPSLFPASAAAAAAANHAYPNYFDSDPPLAKLLGAIGSWLEEVSGKAASIAAFLGGWLRDRLNSLLSEEQRAAAEAAAAHASAAAGGDAGAAAGGGAKTKAVLSKVMFLAVAIGVMLIVRRPLKLSRMA